MKRVHQVIKRIPGSALLTGLLAIPALLVTTAAAATGAGQPAAPIWAKWVLDIRFENNGIAADWTGQVFNGNQLVRQWVDDVSAECVINTPGGVTLGTDAATFSGGTISCNLPSFKQRTFEETQGRVVLLDTCQASGRRIDFWIQATVRDPDFSSGGPSLPFVNHPDFNYTMQLLDAGGGNANTELSVGAMTTQSASFALAQPGASQAFASRINPCNNTMCRANHRVDGVMINQQTIAESPITGVSTPTTITLGSDGTNFYFGDLLDIRIDPGCPATTG
ncbi:MAG: hypothetical protein M9965_16325 [Anaerolineae bacterium]|nr:hypothetical protein [Anaerolineae bacterium]MCO5195228.1 hypothetical protein [Anaerolineae bacterium]